MQAFPNTSPGATRLTDVKEAVGRTESRNDGALTDGTVVRDLLVLANACEEARRPRRRSVALLEGLLVRILRP